MIARRYSWLPGLLVALSAVLLAHTALAAPPWGAGGLFKRIEADPEKSYPVTDTNGPWMILAVTFLGDTAEQQARELVYELRRSFKLPAYTHRMNFDYTGTVEGRGVDQFGAPLKMRYRRNTTVNEVAVLVGDYQSVDDPEGQKVLSKLKYVRPVCLQEEGEVARPLAGLREMQRMLQTKMGDEKKDRGPLGHAFMTTNPVLPPEYFVPSGPDKFVVEMNKDVEYSLLDCPGVYSIRVATFNGMTTIDPKQIKQIEEGKKDAPSRLAQAALDAHKLTQALRAKGYEAYEFHDRNSSIVTVGSFDSLGGVQGDGTIMVDPKVEMILKTFSADLNVGPGSNPGAMGKPKTLAGIPFDIQAMAVEVPRRNISNDYERVYGMR